MYKNLKQLMDEAQALDYTVGAFNAHNLEMVPPMITAAKDAGSPIIIQTSVATAEYVGMKTSWPSASRWPRICWLMSTCILTMPNHLMRSKKQSTPAIRQ